MLVAPLDRADRQLDRKLVTVPMQGGDLDAPIQDRAFAGRREAPQALRVRLAMARRDDQVRQRPADDLGARPSERPLRPARSSR